VPKDDDVDSLGNVDARVDAANDEEDQLLSQMTDEAEKLDGLSDSVRKEEEQVQSLKKRHEVLAEEIEVVDNRTESVRSLSKRKANVEEMRKYELEAIEEARDSKIAKLKATYWQEEREIHLRSQQNYETFNLSLDMINDEANKEKHGVEVTQDKLLAELGAEIDEMVVKEGTPDSSEHFRMVRNYMQDVELKSIKEQLFLAEESRDRKSEEYDTELKEREYMSMHVKSGM
jgi:uncharacterized DUF497 family protein